MNKQYRVLSLIAITMTALLALQSCTGYKKIPYFKNLPDSAFMYQEGMTLETQAYTDIILQPDDILQVSINTIDPSAGIGGNSVNMVQDPMSAASSNANSSNKNISGYLIDKDSNIVIPMAGTVKVGGLTTAQARETIRMKASQFYRDPVVNVRLANFKVTVLGEVVHPGNYILASEKATVLDALGLAGDMSIYAKRENVLLMRREGGKQKVARMNLNTTEPITSPYYYLRQGDVIYVEPAKSKAANTDASMVKAYGVIASTLSLLIVIITRLK